MFSMSAPPNLVHVTERLVVVDKNYVVCICVSHGKAFLFDKSAPTVIAGRLEIPKTLLTPYHLVVSLFGGDRDASWELTEVDKNNFLQRHTQVGCFYS